MESVNTKKETLHQLLLPKIKNLINYMQKALIDEKAPEAVQSAMMTEFMQWEENGKEFESFLDNIMGYVIYEVDEKGYKTFKGLDHEEMDKQKEEVKQNWEYVKYVIPAEKQKDIPRLEVLLNYKLKDEHRDKVRQYLTMFCHVKWTTYPDFKK